MRIIIITLAFVLFPILSFAHHYLVGSLAVYHNEDEIVLILEELNQNEFLVANKCQHLGYHKLLNFNAADAADIHYKVTYNEGTYLITRKQNTWEVEEEQALSMDDIKVVSKNDIFPLKHKMRWQDDTKEYFLESGVKLKPKDDSENQRYKVIYFAGDVVFIQLVHQSVHESSDDENHALFKSDDFFELSKTSLPIRMISLEDLFDEYEILTSSDDAKTDKKVISEDDSEEE